MAFRMITVKNYLKTDQLLRARQAFHIQKANITTMKDLERNIAGNREVIGFGWNGSACYLDRHDFPFPSIRFRSCTPKIMALREKERGDWRKLTKEEKKTLYRASFCQTFAEMNAPAGGEWKEVFGWVLFAMGLTLWLQIYIRLFILNKGPDTFKPERRIAQYYRAVSANMSPISGLYRPPGAEYREFKYNPLSKTYPLYEEN